MLDRTCDLKKIDCSIKNYFRVAKMLRLVFLLTTFVFITGCSPFGNSSFIDNLSSIADDLLKFPFKDTPIKYGDAQAVDVVVTNGSTGSANGYEMQATLQEISDSQTTVSTMSSTPGYTFTEIYSQ